MIDIIMNNKTKIELEHNKKQNHAIKEKIYNFAMRTLGEKGCANFIFDDEIADNTVIVRIEEEEIIYEFKG